jgi:hypothetical protein
MAALMRLNRARLAPLGLVFLLLLLCGCAVPLGPGYHLRRETMVTRFRPGTSSALRIETESLVRNVGNRPLGHITIQMPKLLPAHAHVDVLVAGRSVRPVEKSVAGRTQLIVPFHPPLDRKQSIRFRVDYEITMSAGEFVLEPDDWFATFVRPPHLFAKGRGHAEKTAVKVFLPGGYRALMGARSRGVHHGLPGGATEYKYEIRQGDFPPFLGIGRFGQQRVRSEHRNVVFWTNRPLGARCYGVVADHLVATADMYRTVFGRLFKDRFTIPVIEAPTGGSARIREVADGFGSVPEGIVFSVAPAKFCSQPERYFPAADRALAATWFGWAVAPEPDVRAIMGSGVRRYAALVAEEGSRGAAAQARQVNTWIEEYDRLRSRTKPLAPIRLGAHPLPSQRQMAGIQSALFLIALQDRFGPGPVRRALAHLVTSLRDSTAGLDDVRSALEQATNRNLFDFIGEWLGRAGIPATFRRRYLTGESKGAYQKDSILIPRRAR